MPKKTRLARASAPKREPAKEPQDVLRIPRAPKRAEPDLEGPRGPDIEAPRGNGRPPRPDAAREQSVFTAHMLSATVGIALGIMGQGLGAPPKEQEIQALSECLAAVANKYPVIKYAEEIALVTTLGAIGFRMYADGKEVRAERAKAGNRRHLGAEGQGQVESRP